MKILVISLAGIGDTLFATPLIHELRLNFPAAQIDVLVNWEGARQLLAGNPYIDAVWQKNFLQSGLLSSLRFLAKLRKQRYAVSINTMPQSRAEYRLVARFIGANLRVSHEYDHFRRLTPLLVNRTIPFDYAKHCIDNNLALLNLVGARPLMEDHGYEVFLASEHEQLAEAWLAEHRLNNLRLVGLHLGSGGTKNLALRRWPVEYYCALVKRIFDAYKDVVVLLFGGPQETETHWKLLQAVGEARLLAPKFESLLGAAALLRRCHLFLSVDTVFMHLAAAVGVPRQIVIETPTWNKTIEPYKKDYVLVKNPAVHGRNLEYYKYNGKGIKGSHQQIQACMRSVSVESVYEAVCTLI